MSLFEHCPTIPTPFPLMYVDWMALMTLWVQLIWFTGLTRGRNSMASFFAGGSVLWPAALPQLLNDARCIPPDNGFNFLWYNGKSFIMTSLISGLLLLVIYSATNNNPSITNDLQQLLPGPSQWSSGVSVVNSWCAVIHSHINTVWWLVLKVLSGSSNAQVLPVIDAVHIIIDHHCVCSDWLSVKWLAWCQVKTSFSGLFGLNT